MRYVRPKDVKKMLLKLAKTTYWKKWAAKHECEELEEGVWLESTLDLLRRGPRMCGRRSVARWQGNWLWKDVAERTHRCWMVERKQMPRLSQRRRHGEAQALPLPRLERNQTWDPRGLKEVGANIDDIEHGME